TDAQVGQYADNYFEYDDNARVTLELVDGGTLSHQLSFQKSNNADGYNSWSTKTVETRTDGSQNIVYSNYAGQTMLKVLQSGDSQWCDFYQYSSDRFLLLHPM